MALALWLPGLPAAAQDPPQGLMIGVGLGLTLQQQLWEIPLQPALVPRSAGAVDSLRLIRRLPPSPAISVTATWYRGAHVGWTFDATYLAVRTERRCAPLAPYNPLDGEQLNAQACNNMNGTKTNTNLITLQAGVAWRAAPLSPVQPYARVMGGVGALAGSFVTTGGTVTSSTCRSCRRDFVRQRGRRDFTAAATLGVGVTLRPGPGYQVRVEARDHLAALLEPTGPANPLDLELTPPTRTRVRHMVTLVAGVDVILERRRERRY